MRDTGSTWLCSAADRRHRAAGCRETCLQVILETPKWLATNMQAHTLQFLLKGSKREPHIEVVKCVSSYDKPGHGTSDFFLYPT